MLEITPETTVTALPPHTRLKKLIEVALPLQAINAAAKKETKTTNGHPSTFHLWWGHRPYSVARALIFSSLVDDPSSRPDLYPTRAEQDNARRTLFSMIEQLVDWRSSADRKTIGAAQSLLRQSLGDIFPTIVDPFSGRGTIPLEAQRLGCTTIGADLNPVAVLISKALVEIPARFKSSNPVHPDHAPLRESMRGPAALAADVEAYARALLAIATNALHGQYQPVRTPQGEELPVLAWLWARTVRCPNPVCNGVTPLIKSNVLSAKAGQSRYLKPTINQELKRVTFSVSTAKSDTFSNVIPKRGATCIFCEQPISLQQLRAEGIKTKLEPHMLLGAVLNANGKKKFVGSQEVSVSAIDPLPPDRNLDHDLTRNSRHMGPTVYGLYRHRDLYTNRQLKALTTFATSVLGLRDQIETDASRSGMNTDARSLEDGGTGAAAYADAIITYLAIAISRLADRCSTLVFWQADETVGHVFVRSALSMTWDFVEPNPLGDSTGSFHSSVKSVVATLAKLPTDGSSTIVQEDCRELAYPDQCVIITDPPYYDNIPYSDISEYFYVWLREALEPLWPNLFATLGTPKSNELTFDKSRFHGDAEAARAYVTAGFAETFGKWRERANPAFPLVVLYAFRATEAADDSMSSDDQVVSYGWESILASLIGSGFEITGTWPIGTERDNRFRSQGSNALGSSIALICRPRSDGATRCSRVDFLHALRSDLPFAVQRLREASLAATDLQQAALGPGISVFSRYSEVLEADDSVMTVRSALAAINDELAHILLGEIADVDADTHFALSWFDRYGYDNGKYGDADILLKAKNASLRHLEDAGVVVSERGLVRLLSPTELSGDHTRISDRPTWAQCMFAISALISEDGGEARAAEVIRAIGAAEATRLKDIAYHCYLICDRQKRASDARDFNALVSSWPEIERRASEVPEGRLL